MDMCFPIVKIYGMPDRLPLKTLRDAPLFSPSRKIRKGEGIVNATGHLRDAWKDPEAVTGWVVFGPITWDVKTAIPRCSMVLEYLATFAQFLGYM